MLESHSTSLDRFLAINMFHYYIIHKDLLLIHIALIMLVRVIIHMQLHLCELCLFVFYLSNDLTKCPATERFMHAYVLSLIPSYGLSDNKLGMHLRLLHNIDLR